MYISFEALSNELIDKNIVINKYFEANCKKIEYLKPGVELREDIIYLSNITEFSLHNHRVQNKNFLIIDDLDLSDKIEFSKKINTIIIKKNLNPSLIIQDINEIFNYWQKSLMKLQNILIEEFDTDLFWEKIENIFKVDLEVFQEDNKLFSKKDIKTKNKVYSTEIPSGEWKFNISLYRDYKLSLLEKELLNQINILFEKIVLRYHTHFETIERKMGKTIIDILKNKGPIINPLKNTIWENKETFHLMLSYDLNEENIKNIVSIDEQSIFHLEIENSHLILYAGNNNSYKNIENYFKRKEIKVYTSYPFNKIEELSSIWKALTLSSKIKSNKNIINISENVHKILANTYKKQNSIYPFIHPVVRDLNDPKDNDKTDLKETLYTFLIYERSFLKASQVMNLHRNSIVYRINKINDIYDIDLENPKVRRNLLMSFELIK